MEDTVVFQDRELRRDPLFEHVMREGYIFHEEYLVSIPTPTSCLRRGVQDTTRLREEWEAPSLPIGWEMRPSSGLSQSQWRSRKSGTTICTTTTIAIWHLLRDLLSYKKSSSWNTYNCIKSLLYQFSYGLLRLDAWDRFFYNEIFYKGTRYTPQ